MILTFIILSKIMYLTEQQNLDNCYDPDTSVHMIQANKSVCIDLKSTQNNQCDVLQQGINITISMIIQQNSSPPQNDIKQLFGYYYNFSYEKTTRICIDANNPTSAPNDFYQAQTVQVKFDSIGYQTTFIAGLVQKITGDSSALIPLLQSSMIFSNTSLCFNSTLNTNFIGSFNKDNIVNATITLSYYYPDAGPVNYSLTYINNSQNSNISVTYDSSTHNFSICFSGIDSLTVYVRLYRTDSLGYILMYYNIPNTTSSTESVLQLFKGKTVIYEYDANDTVYKQMNVIIMNNYVALQIVLDPTKESKRQEYQQLLRVDQPNHTALKQLIVYCKEDDEHQVMVYTHNNINFINASQLFKYDIYQPNESIKLAMQRLWAFQQNPLGCTPEFEYQLFGFDQNNSSKIIMIYKQNGNYTKFTCFQSVKYSISGRLEFVRNGIACPWLEEPQSVTFKIINEITRISEGNYKIDNFSVKKLNYEIPLNFTINATIMTLQIITVQEKMIEQVELLAVSEATLNIMRDKGTFIVVISIIESITLIIQIVFKRIIIPKITKKINEKKIMKLKCKNSIFDL